jgi:hypothetical protein
LANRGCSGVIWGRVCFWGWFGIILGVGLIVGLGFIWGGFWVGLGLGYRCPVHSSKKNWYHVF